MLTMRVLRVLLAVAVAGAGALLGAAVHWWVLQPSDVELVTTAREVVLPGFAGSGEPRVTGAWAPSFTRGVVHWDATSDEPLGASATTTSAALQGEGWMVTEEGVGERSGDVVATRPGLVLTVHLRAASDSETQASVELRRGSTTPSLGGLVVGGTIFGAGAGTALARRGLGLRGSGAPVT